MRALRILLLIGICIGLSGTSLFARVLAPPPKYDVAVLEKDFYAFVESLDVLAVSKDYPGAVRKLLSGNPETQIQAVKTLANTGEIEVIPWLLPFLEVENKKVRIWTASSLEKLVSSHVLKRRDKGVAEAVVIMPLRPRDKDIRPLAWVVLKMFKKPDDGNTHAYAASMTRYLNLHEFERELQRCLNSRHPAVSNKAKWALESLKQQNEYETRTGSTEEKTADKRNREESGSSAHRDPLVIETPEIVRILEKEDIAFVGTSHAQTIHIRLKDGREYRGAYVHAQAGKYSDDDHLFDILNLVSHIKEKRTPEEVKDWVILCE